MNKTVNPISDDKVMEHHETERSFSYFADMENFDLCSFFLFVSVSNIILYFLGILVKKQ